MKQITSNFKRCFLNLSRNKRLYSNFQASLREKDGLLFTPGPLKTTMTVKQAMLHDWGSRDLKMINLINNVRSEILNLANVSSKDYTTILMQGSGTFSVEATITSTIPPNGKILVVSNGAYGKRGAKIAKTANINCVTLNNPENQIPNIEKINQTLANDPSFTHVLCIHSETTSGIVNPVEEIGRFVNLHKKKYIVDAMSSFGAIPINLYKGDVDYLISSSNKNIQGVPGFAFVIAKKKSIQETKGWARSVSLDLYPQALGLDHDGQFRFTPPTHSL